ncbi:MAG: thiamine-phosphate kinase [Bacteroidota bacterium]
MEDRKISGLSSLGEFGLIRKLTSDITLHNPSTRKGIGDDAAVLDHSGVHIVVTTDLLLEGIHFDLTYMPLRHLGYKSVIVNLSDVFAMNAVPLQITVSLGISAKMSFRAIEDLYAGIKLACSVYDTDIVGGDTSSSLTGLIISITALGTAPPEQLVYRSGARPGDYICVTGDLGSAYMGLLLLQRENRLFKEDPGYIPNLDSYPYLIERQLKPEAQRGLVKLLHEKGIKPTAMIDISDGLSSDLLHVCEASGTGCILQGGTIPIHDETARMADDLYMSPLVAALNGGEDYEILFTVSPDDLPILKGIPGISVIGHMVDEKEGNQLILPDKTAIPLKAAGWNAFPVDRDS